jgi:hypothetical protein
MNSDVVNTLNEQLGNKSDSPEQVAGILLSKIQHDQFGEHAVGWPEKLFVKINALLPSLVDRNFRKNLTLIKAAACNDSSHPVPTDRPDRVSVAEATHS